MYAATRAQKLHIAVKKTSNQVQERAVMLPHKPDTVVKKPGQVTQKQVLKRKNFQFMLPVKPGMKHKDVWSKEPATETKSSLCSDKQCQSTRCLKKFTRSDNIQSPVRPKYTDDKNSVYAASKAKECCIVSQTSSV